LSQETVTYTENWGYSQKFNLDYTINETLETKQLEWYSIFVDPKDKNVLIYGKWIEEHMTGHTFMFDKEGNFILHSEVNKFDQAYSLGSIYVDLEGVDKNVRFSYNWSECENSTDHTGTNCLKDLTNNQDYAKIPMQKLPKLAYRDVPIIKLETSVELEAPDITQDIWIHSKGEMIIGWLPNVGYDADDAKFCQHIFFARYNTSKTEIRGIFIGKGEHNHGVIIIKAYPSDAINLSVQSTEVDQSNPIMKFHATKKLIFRIQFSDLTNTRKSFIVQETDNLSLGLKPNALIQRCTSNNCRSWYDKSDQVYKSCHSCWTKEDFNRGGVYYDNWIAKSSYKKVDIAGHNEEIPF